MRLKLEVFFGTRLLKTGPIFKAKVGVQLKLECGLKSRGFTVNKPKGCYTEAFFLPPLCLSLNALIFGFSVHRSRQLFCKQPNL